MLLDMTLVLDPVESKSFHDNSVEQSLLKLATFSEDELRLDDSHP